MLPKMNKKLMRSIEKKKTSIIKNQEAQEQQKAKAIEQRIIQGKMNVMR